jgi:hypothetical protein
MSSAASSADFEFFGVWLRMWSSMSSPIRLLMAPQAAARRRRISEHCSSPFSPLSTDSSCPMTFASIILIQRETFCSSGTQIELLLVESGEGAVSDLSQRDGQLQQWSAVVAQLGVSKILFR